MEAFDRPSPAECRLYARRLCGWAIAVFVLGGLAIASFDAFAPNRPEDYESQLEHFYYGSIGSDISGGLPLKVMQVLPKIFSDLLPPGSVSRDYSAFGFIQEQGHPMPIGFSVRRQFVDRTALNCGGCHTGSVRAAPDMPRQIVPGMPANTVNLLAFFKFLFACANDYRFTGERILAAMETEGLRGPLDGVIYAYVVPAMRDALLAQERKLRFLMDSRYTEFGPGRVDTFDEFKYDQFADFYHAQDIKISPDEIYGIVDFPAVWNQAPRTTLKLHWDGNNDSLRERNFSAAIAAGARPEDMDLPRLYRIENWLKELPPPPYPSAIDRERADRGKAVYAAHCASCHAFDGAHIGQVTALSEVGTDRHRLDSYTEVLRAAQQDYTRGQTWAFTHFQKTNGYANQPLDGIWARAPYLHNGSVPTIRDLLTSEAARPKAFTTGGDIYDPAPMGFRHEVLAPADQGKYTRSDGSPYRGNDFVLDTRRVGNSNGGHTGTKYGTDLPETDKAALMEYLKTL